MDIEDLDIAFVLKDEQLLIYLADNKTKKLIKKTDLKSKHGNIYFPKGANDMEAIGFAIGITVTFFLTLWWAERGEVKREQ